MTLCIPHAVRAGQIGLDMKQGDEPLGLTTASWAVPTEETEQMWTLPGHTSEPDKGVPIGPQKCLCEELLSSSFLKHKKSHSLPEGTQE